MQEHLFYTTDGGKRDVSAEQAFSRLYLAAGITHQNGGHAESGGLQTHQESESIAAQWRAGDSSQQSLHQIHLAMPP